MHDSYLILTPILVLGVLGLVRFVGCQLIFGLDEVAQPFLTNQILGTARNNYSGFAGMAIDIGSKSISLRTLGRYCVADSTGNHEVKIIAAEDNTQVPDAAVLLTLSGKTEGFVLASLASQVRLDAGKRYYIVSEELDGGDLFFDNDTAVFTHTDATVISGVYFDSTTGAWTLLGGPGRSYGPIQFTYNDPNE